jgi:hypothetical protein
MVAGYKFYKSDFHRWVINEWMMNGSPRVYYYSKSRFSLRLWKHECGKWYEVGDIVVRGNM